MDPMDAEKRIAGRGDSERPRRDEPRGDEMSPESAEREPGRGTDVEREGLTSRPTQRYPGDGEVPTSDSPRPPSDEGDEDAAK